MTNGELRRVLLLGPPGAGKGTQAENLKQDFDLPYLATGDMMRAKRKEDSELGRRIDRIISDGALVDDEIVCEVVIERIEAEAEDGFLLDGFPRNLAQAATLEDLARAQGHEIVPVLVDVPFDILEKRMTGRRNCPVCGEIYNVYFKPPRAEGFCDLHPEVPLNRRADDNEETIRTRLETYERETRPLIDYYEQSGRLRRVDGTRDPEAIYRDVEKIVNGES